jgi:DNA polymerase V
MLAVFRRFSLIVSRPLAIVPAEISNGLGGFFKEAIKGGWITPENGDHQFLYGFQARFLVHGVHSLLLAHLIAGYSSHQCSAYVPAMQVVVLPFVEFVNLPVRGTALAGTTGFQSPADDYVESRIDLAKELVTTLASVFCVRASGGSMVKVGINDGDILVIDRARTPRSGDIVVADVHELRMVKRLRIKGGQCFLLAEADGHAPVSVDPTDGVHIVGVVKHVVRSL